MLKITIHDSPETLTFQVEGKLVGAWAKELERCWKTAVSIRNRKALIVDLTETLFIDEEGKRVLKNLFQDGAFFRTAGTMTCSIVDEITGKSSNPWRGILTQSMVLLLFVAGSMKAADPAALKLTMREAVQMALKQNPQVVIANLNIAESQENQTIARSGLLPQVNLAGSESVHRNNLAAAFGKKIPQFPGHVGPFWLIQGGPAGSMPVFDLTAWRRWQASKENVTGARAQESTVREENVQLVVSQYLGSLRAAADVKAAQSRVDLAKALFDQAADLQKNGAGTGIDTLRANVQYQNERQRLIDAQTQLQTSLYGLARLLNLDPHQPVELADESGFFQTADYPADQTMERAFTERPEMKALASEIRAQQIQEKGAREQRIPKLSIGGSWNLQGVSPSTAIPVYEYGVSLDVPLFTGGRIQAQTAVAGIELKKLAQQQQELRNRIALEVKTAVAQLDAAKTEVEVANQGVDLAREVVTQARDRFQAGVVNNIEVVTAQDELARANDNQIAALYRYNQARADLAHATGQMEILYAK
ncbi:MAG TPA: TolC family protein [Bryobacteraceae bacterium]|nr:TolC family protein [Bryobacteraceae bacterium]